MTSTPLALQLARPELIEMTPYQSARRIGGSGDIWLNANESPFINNQPAYNRYPEFQPVSLIDNYARYTNLPSDNILASRGADEAIELLIRTFCEPAVDSITICTPTYGMYAISAKTCNVAVNTVPLTSDWSLDPALTEKLAGSKLVFICNPNNPTGSTLTPQEIEPIVEALSSTCIVVVDEAYIEFSPQLSMASFIAKHHNLVVLRTLSKAFGLAGLRCGFMLSNPTIIDLAKKVIAPYPIPAPVGEIAADALSVRGVQQMNTQVAQLNKLKQLFVDAINGLDGIDTIYTSGANFVLIRFNNQVLHNTTWFEQLGVSGIVVRDQGKVSTLDNCLRFSIGSDIEMKQLSDRLLHIAQHCAA